MSIKNRIINKRKELGLNQTELAKRAGLKPPAISQYESGVRNPSYEALLKLSHALNVPVDYLVSGVENGQQTNLDPRSEVLIKTFQNLSSIEQEKILEYTFSNIGYSNNLNFFSNDPKQYANYIFEVFLEKQFPVDINYLAEKINLNIIFGNLGEEAEALLLKKNKTIIINSEKLTKKDERRIKFAIATLIGHYVIPWHTKDSYYHRKSGESSLLTDKIEGMEATTFAASLIIPSEILKEDLLKLNTEKVGLYELEKLAYKKYDVSLNALCNRLIEHDKERFAVVITKDNKIEKVFSGNMPVIEKGTFINKKSKAFELLINPPNEKEFKEGKVNTNVWLIDSKTENDELLYESSVYNPNLKGVFTLLTKIKK